MKEVYKFKTSINCDGCVARVTPTLNKLKGITSWNVDIKDPDKTLTVEAENVNQREIIAAVQAIGFDISEK